MIKKMLLTAAVILAAACSREILSPTGKLIGEVTVESEAGDIPVLIEATGVWRAASLSDWITVDDAWHRDTYSVVLHYGSNQSVEGMHRSARTGFVIIETADGAECDTLAVHQKGLEL
ncbi:MAG: BACON domain-containing protein [Bacteroidales bacterium]|nr:BACON domain-containing protein [Bacteroidales bacterium]